MEAVLTVEAGGAKTRKYGYDDITFFSDKDIWHYVEISDDRLCDVCHANARLEGGGFYTGRRLRAFFPYLMIRDADTIAVNEHPNCRCILTRVTRGEYPKVPIIRKED